MFSSFIDSFKPAHRPVSGGAPTVIRNDTQFLQIWFDPSIESSISLNQGNLVSIDGQGWANTHPANSTGSNRPSYVLNALNGKNVAGFDGTSSYLTINPFTEFTGISGYTLFFLHKYDRLTEQRFTETNATGTSDMGFGIGANGNYEFHASAGTVDSGLAADTNWHLQSMVFDGTQSVGNRVRAWQDDVEILTLSETTPVGTTALSNTSVVYIGCSDLVTLHSQGQMGEIVFFTRALNDAEVNAVNVYMLKKWGLY